MAMFAHGLDDGKRQNDDDFASGTGCDFEEHLPEAAK
jgi:hypothetical protein